jgi:hypothetical protein
MRDVLLLVGGVVAVLVAVKLVAWFFVQRSVETLDFRGPVRAVEVALGAGEVTLRGDGRTDARVRRTMRHGLRKPRLYEHVDDGVLRLRVSSGVVSYELDVPRGAAVHVRGDSASATVIGLTGHVELRAGTGSLEGRALGTSAMHAVTSAGSIRLSFDTQPAEVEVATAAGEVELVLPSGPYDVDAKTERGETKVAVPTFPGARCRVRAHASTGSVQIRPR